MNLIGVFKVQSVALYIIIHSALFLYVLFLSISFLPSISLIMTNQTSSNSYQKIKIFVSESLNLTIFYDHDSLLLVHKTKSDIDNKLLFSMNIFSSYFVLFSELISVYTRPLFTTYYFW